MKIVKADIGKMPRRLGDPMPSITVTLEDQSVSKLFSYYPDEISFSADEFIGLTIAGAYALKAEKDQSYLKS